MDDELFLIIIVALCYISHFFILTRGAVVPQGDYKSPTQYIVIPVDVRAFDSAPHFPELKPFHLYPFFML